MYFLFFRKRSLLVTHLFNFVGALLFGLCDVMVSMEMLILARLVVGFGCGKLMYYMSAS